MNEEVEGGKTDRLIFKGFAIRPPKGDVRSNLDDDKTR